MNNGTQERRTRSDERDPRQRNTKGPRAEEQKGTQERGVRTDDESVFRDEVGEANSFVGMTTEKASVHGRGKDDLGGFYWWYVGHGR